MGGPDDGEAVPSLLSRQGELRISVLPAYLSYDAPWPVRKIPLRCTAHYVAYHVESKVGPRVAGKGKL